MSVISGCVERIGKAQDGAVKMLVVVSPECTEAAKQFKAGQGLGIAALVEPPAADYGRQAQALYQSSFFRDPAVWRAIGSDAQYQAWCRQQKCVVTKGYDWDGQKGEMRCDYAHVRRAGGSGTGIKPEYSGVPLVHEVHQLQHQKGELAVCREYKVGNVQNVLQARNWFEIKAIKQVHSWAWEALKDQLGQGSWKHTPPAMLRQWAAQHGLSHKLPQEYRDDV